MIILLQLIHVLVLWVLEFVPTPEFFIYPYLASHGWIPYEQIVDHHFPGLAFWPLNFWDLGFTQPHFFKVLLVAVVLWQSAWIYKISKNIWSTIVYTIWQPFFEGTLIWYDLFLPVFTLPGFWAISTQKWFLAGVLLGLAVLTKQSILLLVLFVVFYILFTHKKKSLMPILKFGLGGLIPLIGLVLYVLQTQNGEAFWYWNVVFNFSVYAQEAVKGPSMQELIKLLVPVGLVLFSIRFVRNKWLFGWLALSLFGGLSRFGLGHFQAAVPFFALVVGESWQRFSKLKYLLVLISLLWVGKSLWHPETFNQTRFFDAKTAMLVTYIQANTISGEKIFLLGPQPHIYALTDTLPAGNIFVFPMPWLLRQTQNQLVTSLKASPPRLVVYDLESRVDGQYLSTTASSLVEYIQSAEFTLVDQMDSYLIYAYRN